MIFINLIVLCLFIVLIAISKNYEKDFVKNIDEKKYKLKFLYSSSLYLMNYKRRVKYKSNFSKQEESLRAINVGEQIEKVKKIYICNKVAMCLFIIFLFNLLSLFSNLSFVLNQELNDNFISRPDSSEKKTIKLDVYITDEDKVNITEEVILDIYQKQYSSTELNKLVTDGKTYIDSNILKENKSLDEIVSDLNLMNNIPGTDLYVDWKTEDYQLVTRDGIVKNEDLKNPTDTWVTAIINYHDINFEYRIDLKVLPKSYTEEEIIYKSLLEEIQKANDDTITEEKVPLPDKLGNAKVFWKEQKDLKSINFLILGFIVAIVMFIAYDKDLYDKVEKRNQQMLLDYPEIINKITLLLGAGMPLANAWHKIVEDYREKDTKKRYAYEEMIITSNELMLGTSEIIAYERFGRRVKLLPYLRFASLIAQNVKKGSSDLLKILEVEAIESFEDRKELAKRIGEEAGTKLLFPMMLMLLIVLIIVIVPAFLSFQI